MPHPKVCGSRLAEFEQLVRDVMTSYDAAGTAVSIFGRDRTYYEAFFGWRDAKRRLEIAPDRRTFRIQEYHLAFYHLLCAAAESEFFEE